MTAAHALHLPTQIDFGLDALAKGGTAEAPLKEGRFVKVLASPTDGTSTHMAVGIAVLPPAYTTPVHNHAAEEIALVVSGEGYVDVGSERVPVGPGAIVVVPPNVPHATTALGSSPMTVYWAYSPAGSERRWLGGTAQPSETESPSR